MKVIVLNRKRLGVTIIIIGLMLVLMGAEIRLSNRLKMTALMQSGLETLKQFDIDNSNLAYKLPSTWENTVEDLGGGEILYHSSFISKEADIYGFAELWKLRQMDLKTFIENSKGSGFKPDRVSEYKYKPVEVKGEPAYLLTYNAITPSGNNIKAYEYFIDQGDTFFRMAFYVNKDNFRENMPTIFEAIVNNFEKK
ncbi:PsbP-related protein [Clostridium thermarum]|uniref:PsbP-related protein n=1 Tax=Clostridium thermarum TaxID=1716543 RepID=UPI00111E8648|nr:hypothetical protein [Clostridium thermarum]